MAHPSRLNSVIARAVDGSKFKPEWYHKNYLDHVYAVSDDDGDILEHYRYTSFGEVQIYNTSGNQVSTTQIDNHILLNTRRRDELTGYYLYKFRHYSAELGRWLARDPIEERGGVNLYAFIGNDPIGRWDKLGLITCGILSSGSNVTQKGLDGAADRKIANASDNETWIKPGVSLVATWYLDDCTQSLKVEISGSVDSTSKNAAVGVNASFKINAYSESRVCKIRRTETTGNYTANDSWDDIGKVAGAMKMGVVNWLFRQKMSY